MTYPVTPKAQKLHAQAHALLGHGCGKLLRVRGLLHQGFALGVEAIHLFQCALARLQDEAAALGDLQLDLRRQGSSILKFSIQNLRHAARPHSPGLTFHRDTR